MRMRCGAGVARSAVAHVRGGSAAVMAVARAVDGASRQRRRCTTPPRLHSYICMAFVCCCGLPPSRRRGCHGRACCCSSMQSECRSARVRGGRIPPRMPPSCCSTPIMAAVAVLAARLPVLSRVRASFAAEHVGVGRRRARDRSLPPAARAVRSTASLLASCSLREVSTVPCHAVP